MRVTSFQKARQLLRIFVSTYNHMTYCCSSLIMSSGGILHDPEIYDDPEAFNPDRYILSDVGTKKEYENDIGQRNDLSFGGGRVSCFS
jgi:hypothetical protein